MPPSNHHFDSYLHRVHRRWIFWRIIEWVGRSLAITCAFAFVLSLILLVRGESALVLIAICIIAGAMFGAIAGWMTRPGIFQTAGEIDRQFALADLLATALAIWQSETFVADSQDQAWCSTIINLADARCIQLANQSLLLRRYGPRAWGGIGLATATVLTLGFLSSNPLITRAANHFLHPADAAPGRAALKENEAALAERPPVIPLDNQPESADASRINSNSNSASEKNSSDFSGDSAHQSNTAQDHSGAGMGQTAQAIHQQKLIAGHSDRPAPDQSGDSATGSGAAATNGNGNPINHSTATDATASHHAKDWSSDAASASSDESDQKFKTDSVPDAYRDLVKDYFSRD